MRRFDSKYSITRWEIRNFVLWFAGVSPRHLHNIGPAVWIQLSQLHSAIGITWMRYQYRYFSYYYETWCVRIKVDLGFFGNVFHRLDFFHFEFLSYILILSFEEIPSNLVEEIGFGISFYCPKLEGRKENLEDEVQSLKEGMYLKLILTKRA